MRYLLDKPANFKDIARVVLEDEPLTIDSTLLEKMAKPADPVSPEKTAELLATLVEFGPLLPIPTSGESRNLVIA